MRILFHHPLPLDPASKSASGIRPLRMLQAFKDLGCEVDLVTGYAAERKAAIKKVRNNIKSGVVYNFLYSESSTMPTALTEPHHLPVSPLLDWRFFQFCKTQKIPIGLFYRDIYWLFPEHNTGLNKIKFLVAKVAYRYDLFVYKQTLNKLYLPSLEMGAYIPTVPKERFKSLPPGCLSSPADDASHAPSAGLLRLFYVGGISSHYQLHTLFEALQDMPSVHLTLCTREAEWLAVRHEYPALSPNIKVIHKTGVEMEKHLHACDVALLFVKPQEYREFAAPVKLYEYLGCFKPILASQGTLAGSFVQAKGIGWTVVYDKKALQAQLQTLLEHPALLQGVRQNLHAVAPLHTWQARAQQVIEDLRS